MPNWNGSKSINSKILFFSGTASELQLHILSNAINDIPIRRFECNIEWFYLFGRTTEMTHPRPLQLPLTETFYRSSSFVIFHAFIYLLPFTDTNTITGTVIWKKEIIISFVTNPVRERVCNHESIMSSVNHELRGSCHLRSQVHDYVRTIRRW